MTTVKKALLKISIPAGNSVGNILFAFDAFELKIQALICPPPHTQTTQELMSKTDHYSPPTTNFYRFNILANKTLVVGKMHFLPVTLYSVKYTHILM